MTDEAISPIVPVDGSPAPAVTQQDVSPTVKEIFLKKLEVDAEEAWSWLKKELNKI